jgi:hypothetical protein
LFQLPIATGAMAKEVSIARVTVFTQTKPGKRFDHAYAGKHLPTGARGTDILGDIPNYTDISPQIQISEIVVG